MSETSENTPGEAVNIESLTLDAAILRSHKSISNLFQRAAISPSTALSSANPNLTSSTFAPSNQGSSGSDGDFDSDDLHEPEDDGSPIGCVGGVATARLDVESQPPRSLSPLPTKSSVRWGKDIVTAAPEQSSFMDWTPPSSRAPSEFGDDDNDHKPPTLGLQLDEGDMISSGSHYPYAPLVPPGHVPAGPPHNAPLSDLTPSFWLVADPDANPLAREGADRQLPPSDEIIDIVVIGSGITGVTFLLHIVKQLKAMASTKGYRIVMLEARDFCSGATGRNGGHFTPFIFDDFVERAQYDIPDATDDALRAILLEQHSISTMREFIQEHNWAQDVDFVENGHTKLFGATASEGRAEEEDARRDYDAAVAGGLPENLAKQVQWIGKEEMREKYVTKEGEPITGCHYDAANVWPLKLVTKLFQLAASTAESEVATTPSTSPVSVQLFTHTLVQSVTPSPSSQDDSPTVTSSVSRHNWTIATSRGSIQARYVIHATNAYASYLLPQFAPPPPLSTTSSTPESVHTPRARWIQPTRGQIIATRAAKLGPSEIWNGSSWLANRGWEYWFPRYWFPRPPSSLALSQDSSATPDSDKAGAAEKALIIIGGARDCAAPRGEPNPLEAGITDDSTVNPLIGEALRTFLPDVFPDLFNRETEPEYEWTGIMAYTKTLDPMVGPVPISTTSSAASSAARYLPGQFISAGYSGHGMPRAPACAEALAQMVLADMQCLSEGGTEMQWDDWKSKRPKWLPASYLTI